jgi:hypothetical protein
MCTHLLLSFICVLQTPFWTYFICGFHLVDIMFCLIFSRAQDMCWVYNSLLFYMSLLMCFKLYFVYDIPSYSAFLDVLQWLLRPAGALA